ncbi:hypothetical protein [Subtercola lobariae]|uniref:Uncharacterized protein n=1 Tax=Subtercola lobariae TaxID=1588641 RepID=A0A917EZM4_9MICO|nr:hypothetical protein [Subtercola lobariae]GGF37380.1 hypothetical protein GCM10011399_32910 [Subtercola lobariae]
MKAIDVSYDTDSRVFGFHNRHGQRVGISVAPGWPVAAVGTVLVASMLGSGTLIGYLARAAHETKLRLVILTVLTDSGEQVAGPVLSDQLDDDEAGLIMRAAARTDDPISTLRRFVTFRPDRGRSFSAHQ